MSQTQINGATQIKPGSIPWAQMSAGAIVPFASLIGSASIILSTGAVAMGAALNMGAFTVQNSGAPVNSTDLATKGYVDAKTGGIGGFHDVQWVVAANVASLSGVAPVTDGTAVAGDIALLIAQTTQSQNGPWVVAVGSWSRPSWWASATVVNIGQYFIVAEGTTYKDTKFFCTTTSAITVDTTAVVFSQDSSGVTYSAGTGINLAGNAFSTIYGTTTGTSVQGNDARVVNALQTTALGTGVATALGVNIGSAGAAVVLGGALGTPSSGTLTNATGLPIGGLSGLGTGIAAALAVATGLAGSLPVLGTGGVITAADFPALTGDVTTSAGSLATTINHVSGTGFAKYTDFVNETPTGTINGANATFTLSFAPANGYNSVSTLALSLNGVTLQSGSGNDFTISGATVTMLLVPLTGDKLAASYMK